jgi:hypothetical protein
VKEGESVLLYDPREEGAPDPTVPGVKPAPASEGSTAAPGMASTAGSP